LATIFTHLSSSSTPPSQTLAAGHILEAIREIKGPEPREEMETEQKNVTEQHPEFESSLLLYSLLFLITFVRMYFVFALCIFIVFLYVAMSG
jgi:hypothetical protein